MHFDFIFTFQKPNQKIELAQLVMYLFDANKIKNENLTLTQVKTEVGKIKNRFPGKPLIIVAYKTDVLLIYEQDSFKQQISAKENSGVEELQKKS